MTIPATLDVSDAVGMEWDAVVIGAGPAGSFAARELARRGARVLLVERRAMPRGKVCGCCLNGAALKSLEQAGLGTLVDDCGGIRVDQFHLVFQGKQAVLPLPAGCVLSRSALDAALVCAAIDSGAEFLPECTASLGRSTMGSREIELTFSPHRGGGVRSRRRMAPARVSNTGPSGAFAEPQTPPPARSLLTRGGQDHTAQVQARVIIIASGLGQVASQDADEFPSRVEADARIGVGAVLRASAEVYTAGTIFMGVAEEGYAGLVRLEEGGLNIAAAVDRRSLAEHGVRGAVERILISSGLPAVPDLAEAEWHGTMPLTRRVLRPAGARTLLIGDAAAYVEPFTGEGMAWGLASAAAAVPVALRGIDHWTPDREAEWCVEHRRLLGQRLRTCRAVALGLRFPRLVRGAVWCLAVLPLLGRPFVQHFNSMGHDTKAGAT